MKPLHCVPLLALALLLGSCGDGKADAAKQIAAVNDSIKAASLHDLARYHMPLELTMPVGSPAPVISWKEETGELAVSAGEHFNLAITEGPADMARLKGDLERDLLRKNTIVEETPELLVYRSEFPDDTTLVHYHFYRGVTADGRSFTVTDADSGQAFGEADVKAMARAVHAKQPA